MPLTARRVVGLFVTALVVCILAKNTYQEQNRVSFERSEQRREPVDRVVTTVAASSNLSQPAQEEQHDTLLDTNSIQDEIRFSDSTLRAQQFQQQQQEQQQQDGDEQSNSNIQDEEVRPTVSFPDGQMEHFERTDADAEVLLSESSMHKEEGKLLDLPAEVAPSDVQDEQQVRESQTASNVDTKEALISTNSNTTCDAMPLLSKATGNMIWLPAYPGSGSTVMQDLVLAITGLKAADVYKGFCKDPNVVTCKTHWPVYNGFYPLDKRVAPKRTFHDAVMMLVRSPAKTIPSFFNWEWEAQHKKLLRGHHHSVQAPQDDWRRWRDRRFKSEISKWKNAVVKWHKDMKNLHVSLVVPYETLTSKEGGPELLQRIGKEIRKANHTTAKDEDIPCIWRAAVMDKPRAKRTRTYEPGFRQQHKHMMLSVLDEMIGQLSQEEHLLETLKMYRNDISENLPMDDVQE